MRSAYDSAQALVGQKFGKLTVIGFDGKYDTYTYGSRTMLRYRLDVRCECGRVFSVQANSLTGGGTTACRHCASACDPVDLTGQRFHDLTVLAREGAWIGTTKTLWRVRCERCGQESVIDGRHLGVVKSCKCTRDKNIRSGIDKLRSMDVDGTNLACISGDRALNKNNKTGVRGVCLSADGKYRATIVFRRKQYALGEYDSLDDAAKARKAAEDRFFHSLLDEND